MAPNVCRKTSEDNFLEVSPKNGPQNLEDNFLGRFGKKSFALPKICFLLHLVIIFGWRRTFVDIELAGVDPWGAVIPLKPTRTTLCIMISHNSENISKPISNKIFVMFELSDCWWYIMDPLLCHSMLWRKLHLSCSSEAVTRLDYQILLKSPPTPQRC